MPLKACGRMIDPRFYKTSPAITLNELLIHIGMDQLDGALGQDVIIERPCALAVSQPADITFLNDKRRAQSLETAKASACFVTEKLASLVSEKRIIPLISRAPRASFARAAQYFARPHTADINTTGPQAKNPDIQARSALIHSSAKVSPNAQVHPTAIIGPDVMIDDNASIGPYSIIELGVDIGKGTQIGAHCHISFARIGQDCHIKSNAVIGGSGFGVARDEAGIVNIPHLGRVIIGDRVNIGSQSCIDRGQLGDTVLSDDVKIDNLVQIAHNVQIGKGTMMAGLVGISGSCIIGENCQLGGRVGLADHITVGDGAILTASSGVAQNIPAGEIWGGTPALPFREHMRIFAATRKLARRTPQNSSAKTTPAKTMPAKSSSDTGAHKGNDNA